VGGEKAVKCMFSASTKDLRKLTSKKSLKNQNHQRECCCSKFSDLVSELSNELKGAWKTGK
jgi:hypothetical protein